jgi:uncharacterized protein (TIGR03437 family)
LQFWEVTVLYAVASPQLAGLYQIALRIPQDFPAIAAKALLVFKIGEEWVGNSESPACPYPVYLR